MQPANERIESEPDEQTKSTDRRQVYTYCIQSTHRILTHRAHQIVQTQSKRAKRAENCDNQEKVIERIHPEQTSQRTTRGSCRLRASGIDQLRQAIRADESEEEHKRNQHNCTNGDQYTNGASGA